MLPAEFPAGIVFLQIFPRNTLPNYLRIIAGMFAAVFYSHFLQKIPYEIFLRI
jgi:hypothetical protein